jgi:hypothetical protein
VEGGPAGHRKERVLPPGTLERIIDLGGGTPGPLVSGAQSGPFLVDTSGVELAAGVHFKPGALSRSWASAGRGK